MRPRPGWGSPKPRYRGKLLPRLGGGGRGGDAAGWSPEPTKVSTRSRCLTLLGGTLRSEGGSA
eukprot:113819-Pyramimonas_sp.AAC.1